jgi:hypothetical protein
LVENTEKFDQEGFERLKKQYEEYEGKLRERLGKFNINEILRQAKDLRSLFVEDLGEVRYVLLSEADICELAAKYPSDVRERNTQALFRSMAAADSEITLDKLKKLPYDVAKLLQETVLNAGFLSQTKTSKPGSTTPENSKALS